MNWKTEKTLDAPTNLVVSGKTISWQHPTAERFTIYAYPQGLDFSTAQKDAQYLCRVVYGKSCNLDINGLEHMTIAVCTYDRFGVEHKEKINVFIKFSKCINVLCTERYFQKCKL